MTHSYIGRILQNYKYREIQNYNNKDILSNNSSAVQSHSTVTRVSTAEDTEEHMQRDCYNRRASLGRQVCVGMSSATSTYVWPWLSDRDLYQAAQPTLTEGSLGSTRYFYWLLSAKVPRPWVEVYHMDCYIYMGLTYRYINNSANTFGTCKTNITGQKAVLRIIFINRWFLCPWQKHAAQSSGSLVLECVRMKYHCTVTSQRWYPSHTSEATVT